MKIAIDGRPLLESHPGGVRAATQGLVRSLVDSGADVSLWINSSRGECGADLSGCGGARVVPGHIPNKVLNAGILLAGRPHLDRRTADWFVLPNPNFAAFSPAAKVAVLFHDLSFEINRSWFSPRQRLWHRAVNPRMLARRADRVIAVSENTKRDLVDIYGIDEEKIVIVPPYVSFPPFDFAQGKLQRESSLDPRIRGDDSNKFILYLGEVTKRKNVLGLIRAFESVAASFPKHTLVIAGPDGWGSREVNTAIERSRVRDRIRRRGVVSEEEKWKLLSSAEVFVYPSFYEGFGLPVVEAMAAGTPVVASQMGSLPEVVGDAGILIDPYDISTIREAFTALLSNASLADAIRERGIRRREYWRKQSHPDRLLASLEM